MKTAQRNLGLLLTNYVGFTLLTGIGGYLFVIYPQNEALGGLVLGLGGMITGIFIPLYLWRVMDVRFSLLPAKHNLWKVLVGTCVFVAILVGLYPSGILGNKAIMRLIAHPPALIPAFTTFAFLLFSATIYALLFWGGLLHTLRDTFGPLAAILVTSALFSLYHMAEFAFTPLTWQFLGAMFVSGVMCTAFTIVSKSVLPTLLAQQFGQFVHFVALEDNPFSDPIGLFSNTFLLVIGLGVYTMTLKIMKRQSLTPET